MFKTQSMTSQMAAPGGAPASGGRRLERRFSVTGLARWSLQHKRLVVGFWLVLTLLGMAFASQAGKALSQAYSIPGRESYQANVAISRVLGNGGDSPPLVAVVTVPTGTSATSPAVRAGLTQVTARIARTMPHARVASFATTGDPAFISRDGRTTFVVAYPPPEAGGYGQSPKAVTAAGAALKDVTVAGAPVHLTGLGALNSAAGQKSGAGLLAEGLLGALGALVVLAFVFASFLAVVPLLTALVSIMTCFLIVWGLASLTPVSSIVEFLIALVGLGIAIDYTLLVVVRWREERTRGQRGDEAIVAAMGTAGRAVVISGTTVGIGLLALIALPVPFLRSVGYGGILIPLISVAVTVTLLPVILATIGHRLDWPHLRARERASGFWTRWARFVVRRRWAAAATALTMLVLLAGAAATLTLGPATGNPGTISHSGSAMTGLTALERSGIGPGPLTPVEILTPRAEGADLADALRRLPGVQGATAPGAATWHHGTAAVVDVFTHDNTGAALQRIRLSAHAFGPGIRVGGIDAQNRDFISAVYSSFPLMIALIAVLAFALLTRAFRSLLLAAKAVVLNVLSVTAAWGALALIWQHGFGSRALWGTPATGSIPSWLPVIVFAFLFGLSMDYEVFILARIREEYDATGSTDTAVVAGIGRTGRLVTSAALILFLAFTAMSTAPSTLVKMMATGLGAGIILDATIIRALLLPAAISLFGRWNWALPAGTARLMRTSAPRLPQAARTIQEGPAMAVVRIHHYTVDPADFQELLTRRATAIAAIRAAHPGLAETRLTRHNDGTLTDTWRWDSAEQMQAALATMPTPEARAAMSLTRDATARDGEIIDEQ